MNVQEYIISECKRQQLTDEATAALMAQIQAESAFKPNNLEDTANARLGMTDEQYVAAVDNGTYTNFVRDGFGFGIYQLTFYTRKQNYLNYVRARNGSIGDLKLQVGFMFWEFKNYFGGIWSQMMESHDLYALTKVLLEKWENPFEQVENLRVRYKYAQTWLSKVKDFKGVNRSMTQNEAIERVLTVARNEIGYHEKASNTSLDDKTANSGSGNYTKYARDLDALGNFYNGAKQGYAYCDVFSDWCFVKSFGADLGRRMIFQPPQSAGAGCLYSAQYYKQAGHWVTSPQPGDQIFFTYAAGEYSHTDWWNPFPTEWFTRSRGTPATRSPGEAILSQVVPSSVTDVRTGVLSLIAEKKISKISRPAPRQACRADTPWKSTAEARREQPCRSTRRSSSGSDMIWAYGERTETSAPTPSTRWSSSRKITGWK